jgi:cellulose synthase/poly-beta-1,6-N-acetylglucosamine synthase-like glycosyltransferase
VTSVDTSLVLPYVSVIVAVRDGERTIGACVDSLLALDYPSERVELLAVDNGSRDGTRRILETYRGRLRIADERVRGPGAARNRGLLEAAHPVVAFTDADCRVDPAWLRHLVAPLRDESVGIAGGRILAIDPANPIERFGETLHDHQRAMTHFRPPYAITMNWASRLGVLREQGLFDPSFLRGEDSELSFRLFSAGYRLVYVPEAIVFHHHRSTRRGLLRAGFQSGVWSVAIHRKHHAAMGTLGASRFAAGTYRPLLLSLLGAAEGRDEDAYFFLFHLGRKLGRVTGSVRFGHLRL